MINLPAMLAPIIAANSTRRHIEEDNMRRKRKKESKPADLTKVEDNLTKTENNFSKMEDEFNKRTKELIEILTVRKHTTKHPVVANFISRYILNSCGLTVLIMIDMNSVAMEYILDELDGKEK